MVPARESMLPAAGEGESLEEGEGCRPGEEGDGCARWGWRHGAQEGFEADEGWFVYRRATRSSESGGGRKSPALCPWHWQSLEVRAW
jgi:hypothetical protein